MSERPSATKTVEQVDAQALADAQSMLGTSTPQDTVNEALREAVRRRMVGEYLTYMKELSPTEILADRHIAWR